MDVSGRFRGWGALAWLFLLEAAVLWLVLIAINPCAAVLPFLVGWDLAAWWYGVPGPSTIPVLR